MTRKEFLERIEKLGLDRKRFCIISGGVMLMYGLREETGDIDIKMSPKYFTEIRDRFSVRKSPKFDYLYELEDGVEVAVMDYGFEDVVEMDGYLVESLQKQLEWKIANGREKDREDIERIREFLRK